jgi:hypothetical protein
MKASGTFVQIELPKGKPKGFVSTETVMREGVILSIGKEALEKNPDLKVGMKALFSQQSHVIEHASFFFVDYKSIVAISK